MYFFIFIINYFSFYIYLSTKKKSYLNLKNFFLSYMYTSLCTCVYTRVENNNKRTFRNLQNIHPDLFPKLFEIEKERKRIALFQDENEKPRRIRPCSKHTNFKTFFFFPFSSYQFGPKQMPSTPNSRLTPHYSHRHLTPTRKREKFFSPRQCNGGKNGGPFHCSRAN